MDAVHKLGMPEARIVLSQAVTYLASPKSNRAYLAINEALSDVKRTGSLEVPMHLRNAPTQLMKQFGIPKAMFMLTTPLKRPLKWTTFQSLYKIKNTTTLLT